MLKITNPKYRIVTISGKIASGTTTLARNLSNTLKWRYINAGEIQRQYDRVHNIDENKEGAIARPDSHEREIDDMTVKILKKETDLVYEAWLSGFMAQNIKGVLKILLYCSVDAVRIDRVMNRDKLTMEEAKTFIYKRENENITKWKKLYGDHDFWSAKYYDIVIDTFSSGPMETLGKILDKISK